MFGRSDEASGSPFPFLVAGFVFVATVASGLLAAQEASKPLAEAEPVPDAAAILDVLLHSRGHTQAGADWVTPGSSRSEGAEDLARLGLRGDEGALDFWKIENLRLAPEAATDDGFVNYEEARASLALAEAGLGFHLRAVPALASVRDLLERGPGMDLQVAYVGDVEREERAGPVVVGPTCTLDGLVLRLSATVQNPGEGPTQFQGLFRVAQDGALVAEATARTGVLEADATGTLEATLPALGLLCPLLDIDLYVYDVATRLTEAAPPDERPAREPLAVTPTLPYFLEEGDVSLELTGAGEEAGLTLTVKRVVGGHDYRTGDARTPPGATVVEDLPLPAPTGDALVRVELDEESFQGAGLYVAFVAGADGVEVTAHLALVDEAPEPFRPDPSAVSFEAGPAVADEAGYLEDLVASFCPYWSDAPSDSAVPGGAQRAAACPDRDADDPGDVLPDRRDVLAQALPARLLDEDGEPDLARTSTLVVGSGVDHQALATPAVRDAVAAWVRAGGTLVVLGSDEQQSAWLEPLFDAAIGSSSGGIRTPDEAHPLLQRPNVLQHSDYDHRGRAWHLGDAADAFVAVVSQGDEPVLAVSRSGAFDAGMVALTTWEPHDVMAGTPAGEDDEGLRLTHNLLAQAYRGLFLDYGPAIPDGVEVRPAVGLAQIVHPQVGTVPLQVVLYVFPEPPART